MNFRKTGTIPNFLVDTWWFGLTQRLNDKNFKKLAQIRIKQGFGAAQVVVGIPPEVGLKNPNAESLVGPAWFLNGRINKLYLEMAREKVKLLNQIGLTVIVYGAWGYQIEWLGVAGMKRWWQEIIKTLDDLEVIYCLSGEINLWPLGAKRLLPDKTTDDLVQTKANLDKFFLARKLGSVLERKFISYFSKERKKKWSEVLKSIKSLTKKPILVHVTPGINSNQAVENPEMLAGVTVQTGHSYNSKSLLWRLPLAVFRKDSREIFINLEPWYEGILDKFGQEDQLYAYWSTMMAGAHAYCYGAHGIWNVGDGKFLSHWGRQTFGEALKLSTPRLIGISHQLLSGLNLRNFGRFKIKEQNGELVEIKRLDSSGQFVSYIPEVSLKNSLPKSCCYFSPVKGQFLDKLPKVGQLVIFSHQIDRKRLNL